MAAGAAEKEGKGRGGGMGGWSLPIKVDGCRRLLTAAGEDKVWYWQGDNRRDHGQRVGASEVAGSRWCWRGRSAKMRQCGGDCYFF